MIKLGFSGGGYWGSNLVRAAMKIPGVKVVGIADPDAGARQRIASLVHGDIKTHACFDYLLSDAIDAVVIATPPALHVEQAVAALGRGKAVFLEKPPVMNLLDLDRLLNAARGKTLSCDYVFCHNALIQFAKGLMKQVGFVPVTTDLRWTNWGIVRQDVDAWWSAGPHPISVLCYLFEQVDMNWCTRGNGYARAHLRADGASSSVMVSWHHPVKERRMEFVGVDKTILIKDVEKKVWVIEHDDEKRKPSVPKIEYGEPLVNALTDFVKCVEFGGEPITGPMLIEKVTRLMCDV